MCSSRRFNQNRLGNRDRQRIDGLLKSDFKRLLEISTKGTVFYFNGCYYRQIDGVAMGSPLGPALANAFLSHYEQIWLDECPLSFSPMFYVRYVDDVFVLLRSNDHLTRLSNYFSSKHPNIRFTFEVEKDNCLPFLDVDVFRENGKLSTSVHRKDTFSGVFTNFKAFLPDVYKKGLVATLLHRAYTINSSFLTLHAEVEKLKTIFKKNGYPANFIDRCILKFFNKMYRKRDPVHTVPKKDLVITLPFLGSISWTVKNELVRTASNIVPFCNVKVVFKSSSRISSFFKFKDNFPKSLLSGVIYHYHCARCTSSYIGSTKRFWLKRLEEHTHISSLTGKQKSGCQVFAPMYHVQHKCSYESPIMEQGDYKIIGREDNPYLLRVKESIFIYKFRPDLNDNNACVPLELFKP